MNVIKPLFLISLFTILQNIDAVDETVQVIDHPHKNEYILQQPGSDKHKYGYELKENKHFHHTTTEEDGVRLGCYGYVLNGKKYSTQYVADAKGYRPVYTYDVIKVYPKSGEVREASFIRNFDEDSKKSENIRYFFPEGCRGDDHMVIIPPEQNKMTPPPIVFTPKVPTPTKPFVTKITEIITPPPPPPPVVTQPPIFVNTPKIAPPPDKYLPPAPTYLPPKGKYITKEIPIVTTPRPIPNVPKSVPIVTQPPVTKKVVPPPAPKPTPKKPIITEVPKSNCEILGNCVSPTITIKNPPVADTCNAKSCCNDDALPKLVIPINLSAGRSGECGRFAKLIVPADSVGMESLKTLLSNPSELAKTIIKSLS